MAESQRSLISAGTPTQVLLGTKLHVPSLRPNLVPRPRLLEQVDAEGAARLIVVSAPAGFGKSTLLVELCRTLIAQGNTAVAWYSLDEADNDPTRFLSYLVESLARALGGEADLEPARQAAQNSPSRDAGEALTLLINSVESVSRRCLVVVDDYHVITSPPIHSAVSFLVTHLPPGVCIALGTRTDPPLQLSRLRAQGGLVEIRSADLRFSREETTQFFRGTAGLDLTHLETEALDVQVEGWAAGLQLISLALRKQRDSSSGDLLEWITRLAAPRSNLFDYLADEVFDHQPSETRSFLLDTSLLEQICPPLCDAVAGRSDSGAVLDLLERDNLFLSRLDDEGAWYRYHNLFRDFLRTRLAQEQPDRLAKLHQRATCWYEEAGLIGQAIHHALATPDYWRAAELIEATADSMWLRNEVSTLLAWIDDLPKRVLSRMPRLHLQRALAVLHSYRLEEAATHLESAERALVLRDGTTKEAAADELWVGKGSGSEERGMLAALRSIIAINRGDACPAENLAIEALDLLPPGNAAWRGIALVASGVARGLAGDMVGAQRALAGARADTLRAGHLSTAIIAGYNLAVLQVLHGSLREAAQSYGDVLRVAEERGARHLHCVGESYSELGMVLCEWGDLDGAQRHASEALDIGRTTGNDAVVAQAQQLQARISQARGDIEGAIRFAEQASRLAQERGMDTITASAAAQEARLKLLRGDAEGAFSWARSTEEAAPETGINVNPPAHQYESEAVTLARVQIAQGRLDEAREALARLLTAAESGGYRGRVVEALALKATACQLSGQSEQALGALARALELAEPEGYVRTFLDGDSAMEQLLRAASRQQSALSSKSMAYTLRLLAQHSAPSTQYPTRPPILSPQSSPVEALSHREIEVLRLVARGAPNQEIADTLVITLSTVKAHLNHVLGKLGVRNRTEAVTRARELRIL